MEPTVDHDLDPVWSPDGKQVAFLRMATGGSEGSGRGGRRSGEPWSIHVASVSDGTGRQIWKSDAGAGSVFHAMISEKQLYWGAGDRLMFPWERDGWRHLYSVGVEGGAAKLLTPGNFEVEHVVYSADGKEAVYSSNQDDIDRCTPDCLISIWHLLSTMNRAILAARASGYSRRRVDFCRGTGTARFEALVRHGPD
jgi:Tol biopolymer transport system component